jgi:hypothetical protein
MSGATTAIGTILLGIEAAERTHTYDVAWEFTSATFPGRVLVTTTRCLRTAMAGTTPLRALEHRGRRAASWRPSLPAEVPLLAEGGC